MTDPITRASGAARWINCPVAPWLEPQYPNEDGEAAREGTAAHEMAELVLTGKHTIEEIIDRQASNGVMMVDEMVPAVQMYVDHIQSEGVPYWIEESILIESPSMPGRVPGRCDGATFNYDDATGMLGVKDFKYGFRPVEVFEWWSGIVYAIGIRQKIDRPIRGVKFTIIQPRGYHHDGPIRSWTITEDQLIGYTNHLIERMKAVHDPNRQCVTGGHCRDCKHMVDCAAAKAASMNAIDVIMSEIPHTTTPDQIAVLLDTLKRASDTVKHIHDAITARGEAMILDGHPIPGYSYEPGKGKTKFINEEQAIATAACFGVDITEVKTVTPAEAKRRKLPDAVYKSLTTIPSTAPRLVKRDASTQADKVFGT